MRVVLADQGLGGSEGTLELPAERAVSAAQAQAVEGPRRKVAVIVAHGMGQQAKFETLGTLTEVLAAEMESKGAEPEVEVSLERLGDGYLPRARLGAGSTDGPTVDVFEIYWAPMTEGQIGLVAVLAFLLRSAWLGMKGTFSGYKRFAFGEEQPWKTSPWDAVLLAILWLLIVALLVLFGWAVAVHLDLIASAASVSEAIGGFATDVTLVVIAVVAPKFGLAVVGWFARRDAKREKGGKEKNETEPKQGAKGAATRDASTCRGTWSLARRIGLLIGGAVLAYVVLWCFCGQLQWSSLTLESVVAIVVLVAGWAFGNVLIQYVGDVVIYVSSHELNRYCHVREAIQTKALAVAKAVYDSEEQYDEIVFVGHSLGSVIAYDTLNAILREPQRVFYLARTRALVTFGSPLDKTAFIFRAQVEARIIREGLANAVQPMLTVAVRKQVTWVNLWSRMDIISGPLDYYDPPCDSGAKAVRNVRDPAARVPLLAHTRYWNGARLKCWLRACVVQRRGETKDPCGEGRRGGACNKIEARSQSDAAPNES
ncbi:MAG: hypothetical protein JNJ59_02060 [Deltaproteobacteria bacterium]|nr:hypothetical protein [Deltaproteobacteria bacterium]